MFFTQSKTRTSAPPPRVIYHDFNDEVDGGILSYQRPEVGERVILADHESVRVWATVSEVRERRPENNAGIPFWVVDVTVDWDTLRNK